ncbi:MAG: GGDEF domain-containing protein, partial [Xanthobacteraceae bacterium]
MHLDPPTISIVTVFVAALLGALLVFGGLQNRGVRAPMWWGAAHIINAGGFALLTLRGAVPNFVSIDVANALVLLGYGLTWTGARVFDARPIRLPLVLLWPLTWMLLCRIPAFADDAAARIIVGSTLLALLVLLAAEEFWRGRGEPLMSRWPIIVVLLAHATVLVVRVPVILLSAAFGDDFVFGRTSFTLFAFGTLLYTVVLAFLQLNMTKERTELKHKINSLVDPLSGVANRRAFLDGAAALLSRQENGHEPLAILLFDLDHFKQINDRFGHAAGDAVLQTFAATATQTLGADILFARIGGEEFAIVTPESGYESALEVARKLRSGIAQTPFKVADRALPVTASFGVCGLDRVPAGERRLAERMLKIADQALYR